MLSTVQHLVSVREDSRGLGGHTAWFWTAAGSGMLDVFMLCPTAWEHCYAGLSPCGCPCSLGLQPMLRITEAAYAGCYGRMGAVLADGSIR